jgi:hypothetical protein
MSAIDAIQSNPFLQGLLQAIQAVAPLAITAAGIGISPQLKAAQELIALLPLAEATLAAWAHVGLLTGDQARIALDGVKGSASQAHSAWLASVKLHPPITR